MNLFPVALNLQNRRCLVVGGGRVGSRKALSLLECSAKVVVVSPTIQDSLQEPIRQGTVEYIAGPFIPAYLDGVFLCVAATDNHDINQAVAEAAQERGILLNLAGQTTEFESGDFITMATVRRGDLLLSVTTGGAGPALSVRLRKELETQYGPEWYEYTELLRRMRQEAKSRIPAEQERTAALRRLAEKSEILTLIRQGESETAEKEAKACLFVS